MPVIRRSTYGFFVLMLFVVLLIWKIAIGLPLMTFAIFGIGFVGLIEVLVVRFYYKEKSKLDILSFVIGGLMIIWVLAEIAFPH